MKKVTGVGIVTVGGDDFHPLHVGTVNLSWKDDSGTIHDVTIENALHFPTSPVNVISVGKLSSQYDDNVSSCDYGTLIKSTCNISWLS